MTTTAGGTAGGGPPAPLPGAVCAASAAVSDVAAMTAGPVAWQVADADVLDGIRRVAALRSQVEAVYLDLVRDLDRRGLAATSPVATTPEGFLRTSCLVGAGQARRDVAAARATAASEPLAPLAADLADGRGSRAHLDVAVRCLDRLPASLLARPRAAADVVAYLRTAADDATPLDLDRAARQLLARIDPDGSERRQGFDPDGHTRRFVDLHTDATGMVVGAFQLDPVSGATLRSAMDAASAPEPGADGEPDRRQPRQRRADALVRLAETALGVAVPRRGERPRVVVHVTPAQVAAGSQVAARSGVAAGSGVGLGWLETGDPVAPTTVRRLTCDAVLQRVVSTPSLGPLDVGREHRLVTLAQRRALAARDGGCVVPGCGAPPDWCDAHHVVHWADGGASDVSNFVLLCPGHHTAVHAGTWRVELVGATVTVTPPRWVDPSRTPRPARHRVVASLLDDLDRAAAQRVERVEHVDVTAHDDPGVAEHVDVTTHDPDVAEHVHVTDHDDLDVADHVDLFADLPPAPRPVVADDVVQRLLLAEALRPSRAGAARDHPAPAATPGRPP